MTEFTSETIAEYRKYIYLKGVIEGKDFSHIQKLAIMCLDHIERQAARIEELEIKQHIHWDADMMLTMADNSKGYIDLIIELQTKLKELENQSSEYCKCWEASEQRIEELECQLKSKKIVIESKEQTIREFAEKMLDLRKR